MKSAIVGCGAIAEVHAKVLSESSQTQLCAFADIDLERATSFANRFGGRAYSSLEKLLEQESIDVLHICTPHHLHTPMVEQAVAKGIAVFSEKPPVITVEQWERFCAASQRGTVGVCFQNRYNASVRYLKERLSSGKFGKLLGARAVITWSRDEDYYVKSGWRGKLETEGGGVLINQSIHTMDLLVEFLGKPVSVDATLSNHHLKQVIEVEDTLEAYIQFDSCNAVFYATNAHCSNAPVMIELCCEEATLRMEEQEITCFWKDGRQDRKTFDVLAGIGKDYWGASHQLCIEDFYQSLQQQERFGNDLDGIRNTILLMLATYRSAREGHTVEL